MKVEFLHTAKNLENRIFSTISNFNQLTLEVFRFQSNHCKVYSEFTSRLNINTDSVNRIEDIPFMPVDFFKSQRIICWGCTEEVVFESSGTTGSAGSKHYVAYKELYITSFLKNFENNYGSAKDLRIFGLLPSYLERGNSSLVYMVNELISQSLDERSSFYLQNYDELAAIIKETEKQNRKSLLLGVTYALLDFAEQYPMHLHNTIVMETGGMKGRKEEMTRNQVHTILKKQFNISHVHSEYGMTELLSQAYAQSDGLFHAPPWMRMLVRGEDDPLAVSLNVIHPITGAANIIDLANLYSCSFIATDDIVRLNPDNSFEILGRLDNSDVRGCSLLSL